MFVMMSYRNKSPVEINSNTHKIRKGSIASNIFINGIFVKSETHMTYLTNEHKVQQRKLKYIENNYNYLRIKIDKAKEYF